MPFVYPDDSSSGWPQRKQVAMLRECLQTIVPERFRVIAEKLADDIVHERTDLCACERCGQVEEYRAAVDDLTLVLAADMDATVEEWIEARREQ